MTEAEILSAIETEVGDRLGPRLERFAHSFAARRQLTVDILAEDLNHPSRGALPRAVRRLVEATEGVPLEGYRVLTATSWAGDEHVRIDVMTKPLEAT